MSVKLTAAQKAEIENKRLDALDRKRTKANQRLEKESLKSSIDKKVYFHEKKDWNKILSVAVHQSAPQLRVKLC